MGTLCLSGAALFHAGANVSSALTETDYDYAIKEAEALISQVSRYDWVANYGSVKTNFKKLLEEICAKLAAIDLVKFDMSGYTSRIEAEDVINVLRDAALRGLSLLRDQKGVTFGK